MEITYLYSKKFKPHKWSGGTTTELFIFPETANYQQRNFDFRLSTATVEVETSDFTPLHGVSRTLMILDGEMSLDHAGHHSSNLKKFDVDEFDGGWATTSKGRCTDFNLMTIGQTRGGQEGILIQEGATIDYPIDGSWGWLFFYAHSGSVHIDLAEVSYSLQKGDLLVMQNPENPSLQLSSKQQNEVVLCWIKKDV